MTISGNTIAHEALSDQNARDYRRLIQRMLQGYEFVAAGGTGSGGVARSGDLAVSQRGAGANMSVDVAIGGALAGANSGATGYSATAGSWWGFNDAILNIPISASDPVNARIDLIGIAFRDAEYAGATNDCQLTVITGTAAGVPAEPAVPATYHGWVTLARVDVAALAASIVNGNITDRRKRLSALGGVVPVANAADLAAITSPWEGLCAIDMANDIAYNYDGAAFVPLGQYARAWSAIQDIVLGGDGAITFSSIPATFTHLALIGEIRSARAAATDALGIRFNNDTTGAYNWELLNSTATVLQGLSGAADTNIGVDGSIIAATANAFVYSSVRIEIPHYRNGGVFRSMLSQSGTSGGGTAPSSVCMAHGDWGSGATINRIDLWGRTSAANLWKASSRFMLLGIR